LLRTLRARRGIDEQHEPPLRAGKRLQQAFEQPRQHIVDGERGADGPIQADHRLELRLGQVIAARFASRVREIELRHDHRRRLALEDHLRSRRRRRRRRGRRPRPASSRLDVSQPQAADRDLVSIDEPPRRRQRLTIDERAVPAAEVLDRRPRRVPHDCRVLAADRGLVEHDVAARMAAHDGTPLGEVEPRVSPTRGDQFEMRHARKRPGRAERRGRGPAIADPRTEG